MWVDGGCDLLLDGDILLWNGQSWLVWVCDVSRLSLVLRRLLVSDEEE